MTDEATGTIKYRPGEMLRQAERRFGSVIRYRAGTRHIAYLLGPEANKFVFAHDELFTMREAMAGLIPVDGPTALVVSDGPDHRRRRRLVQPAMHRKQVDGYVDIMVRRADEELATWHPGTEVDAYTSLRGAIRRSTIESLFGADVARDDATIAADLQPLLDLVDQMLLIPVHERLRTPTWRRAMAARDRLDTRIYAEIARVRAAPTQQDHVLATLVHGRDGDGDGLSDPEVRDQTVSLIAAGHETTSGAAGWLVYTLGAHPEVRERARDEVEDILGDRPPTAADLPYLTYLQAVVQEVLRLYPPATVSARHVDTGFEYDHKWIRPGTLLMFSPYVTHHSADLYPHPDDFRPERWLTDDNQLRRLPPEEFLPFGGGAHRCIGSAMATTQLEVLLARLVMQPAFTLAPQRIRGIGMAALRPKGGLRVLPG